MLDVNAHNGDTRRRITCVKISVGSNLEKPETGDGEHVLLY